MAKETNEIGRWYIKYDIGYEKANQAREPNEEEEFVCDCQRYVSECMGERPCEWQTNGWQQQLE